MLKEYVKKPCEGLEKRNCKGCEWDGGFLGGREICGCPSEPRSTVRKFEVSNDGRWGRTTVTATEFLNALLNTPEYLVSSGYLEAYSKAQKLHQEETRRHEEAIARAGIEVIRDLPNVKEV